MQLFPDLQTARRRQLQRQRRPWAVRGRRAAQLASRAAALVAVVTAAMLALDATGERFLDAVWDNLGQSVSAELTLPEPGEFGALAERSFVVDQGGAVLATLHAGENRRIVELDGVPDHVWQAILAAEDRRFFEHEGYDPRAISRAATENLQAGDLVQGGSTITQQLAKTFVGDEVTFERKYEELLQAMALERHYSKETLLGRYLNEVYFGAGAYGVYVAAEEFFGERPSDLTIDQAALLAGLIRSPERLSPRRNPEAALARRNAVLAGMAEEGFIEPGEAVRQQSVPLEVKSGGEEEVLDPFVVEAIKREFLANPAFGETREERVELLFEGGVIVESAINPDLQRRAEELIRQRFPSGDNTAAIAAVDPRTGRVHAAASGRDFDQDQFNLALQGRRQPGSAYKTFVLTAALDEGIPLSTTLEGRSGSTFGTWRRTGDWATRGVRNFGGASYSNLNARQALIRSVNTAFADLVLQVGSSDVTALTDRMGISRAAYGGLENPAIALGGLDRGVTPLEMASAYGVYATGGEYAEPFLIERVTDRDGEVLYEAEPQLERVLDPDVSAVMRDVLEQVVRSGTGTQAQLSGWTVAGKTGTSQDLADVWFAGTTSKLSAAVWVGDPTSRQRLWGMSSSGTAAPLWRDFMEVALAGEQPEPFPDSDRRLPRPLLGRPAEPSHGLCVVARNTESDCVHHAQEVLRGRVTLLGRPAVNLDLEMIRGMIAGRSVLVTGAGGSIGSEIVRQVASFGASRLLLFENSEYALYKIDQELAGTFPQIPRSTIRVDQIMTPRDQIGAVRMDDVLDACVGDIMATLRYEGRQHAIVLDRDEDGKPRAVLSLVKAVARHLGGNPPDEFKPCGGEVAFGNYLYLDVWVESWQSRDRDPAGEVAVATASTVHAWCAVTGLPVDDLALDVFLLEVKHDRPAV
jgi:penicillin-binding protein 1A